MTLAVGLVLGLAIWNLYQARELNRARRQVIAVQATMDSLQVAQHRAASLGRARGAERLDALEKRVGRLSGGVRHAELMAVRGWISRLESRIANNEESLASFEGRLEQGLGAAQDSIAASRTRLETSLCARFSAAERARGGLAERQTALERRVDGVETLDRSRSWRRVVRVVPGGSPATRRIASDAHSRKAALCGTRATPSRDGPRRARRR